jgi:hypothetical protein
MNKKTLFGSQKAQKNLHFWKNIKLPGENTAASVVRMAERSCKAVGVVMQKAGMQGSRQDQTQSWWKKEGMQIPSEETWEL